MNYYLIWTDKGWLKTPTYNHSICRRSISDAGEYNEVNATYNIRYAYKFEEDQIKEALGFLQGFGVASWAIELKEDMLQNVLQELKQNRKEKING